jgi:hypothetical protein
MLNIEHRLMLHFAPDLDSLSLMQRVEVFQHALSLTEGMDLYRVLWMKAPSSEAWLERRTNFSRSLAVMSMVGHILGLGDRHPSNLMLHRYTGKILHIDFGDCFEVAMRRDKFPETVPFRLTRMLVQAMEVSAIEGTFRSTCERVMGVLRQHKDSLMAMLEAFIHDPLIKWRLLQSQQGSATASSHRPSVPSSARPSLPHSLRASLDESFGYATAKHAQASLGEQPTPIDSVRAPRARALPSRGERPPPPGRCASGSGRPPSASRCAARRSAAARARTSRKRSTSGRCASSGGWSTSSPAASSARSSRSRSRCSASSSRPPRTSTCAPRTSVRRGDSSPPPAPHPHSVGALV